MMPTLSLEDVCHWMSELGARLHICIDQALVRARVVFSEVVNGNPTPVHGLDMGFGCLFPGKRLSLKAAIAHLNSSREIVAHGYEGDLRRFLALALCCMLALTELQHRPYTKVYDPVKLQVQAWSHCRFALLNDAVHLKGLLRPSVVLAAESKCPFWPTIRVEHVRGRRCLLWVCREHLEDFAQRYIRQPMQFELDMAWREVFGELPKSRQTCIDYLSFLCDLLQ